MNVRQLFQRRATSPETPSRTLREEWFGNVRGDLLAGTTVSLALIPEAIAFSLIAGLAPQVGLYAAFIIAVSTAFFGGRPGMISAATGALALLMVDLVANHGLEYLLAATILTGVFQVVFRLLRLSRYIKFVPRPVMTGFVNALAILIFMAQIPAFKGATWHMYALVVAGLAIIYGLPKLTKSIPSPLVAIVVLGIASSLMGWRVANVGDMGPLPTALPFLHIPQVPYTIATFKLLAPYAVAFALVGIVESLLTASVVDEMTDTTSCKHAEARGQGVANIIAGFFGGMAGCAMIGQSVINVQSGGRGRLSSLTAGVFLITLILLLGDLVAAIPMGALVAVMFAVSIGTFDWNSIRTIRTMPVSETLVMVLTVSIVLISHDLALGVLSGVLASALLFVRKVSKLIDIKVINEGTHRTFEVHGQIFFGSVDTLRDTLRVEDDLDHVTIDLSHAHVWDASAVAALDATIIRMRGRGIQVDLRGLNDLSSSLMQDLATFNRPELQRAGGH